MRPVLISAGATRNPLDAIRYLSAQSTGRTGVWFAEQLAPVTAVTLLGSDEAILRAGPSPSFQTERYGSTRDLLARMERWTRVNPQGIIVHASAVGDYEADPKAAKIPSGQQTLVLTLRPTPKILDQLVGFSQGIRLVSFKAASPETTDDALEQIATAQLKRTRSDVVFANVIGRTGSRVLLMADQPRWFAHRREAMQALVETIRGWLGAP